MPTLPYLRYDVFTDEPYGGNPLAVVIAPPPLTSGQMQRIAAALNLSETIFLAPRPDEPSAFDARIFTPTQELPFAGHPTIGAAIALADHGWLHVSAVTLPDGRVGRIGGGTLHEGVGPVDVVLDGDGATLRRDAPPESLGQVAREDAAAVLGLDVVDLHPDLEPQIWSGGVPYTLLPVRDLDALARAAVDSAVFAERFAPSAAPGLYVVCPLDGVDGTRWRTRMFAPELGIVEDPATGSAVASLYGMLADPPTWTNVQWTITQGVEMGRPSTIRLRAELGEHGADAGYSISGQAVQVGEGRIAIPPVG